MSPTANLMYAGIGLLTAIIVYKVIVKRNKADETITPKGKPVEITKDNKSSFCVVKFNKKNHKNNIMRNLKKHKKEIRTLLNGFYGFCNA